MNIEQYIHSLGLTMDEVSIDQKGEIFILIEDNNPRADSFYREIGIPLEYQTLGNVEIIRQHKEKSNERK